MLKVGFYGSTELSLRILEGIHYLHTEKKLELVYVVSNPSKPFGRKGNITDNPVVDFCKKYNINHFTPNSLKDFEPKMVDIAFVAAYGKIIPKRILDRAKSGFLNFHGSVLPKYRGATPIQTAILNRDKFSGLTIIKMDEGMDTGDIIYTEIFNIEEKDTTKTLMVKLANRAYDFLVNFYDVLIADPSKWVLRKQNDDEASYCKISDFDKNLMRINYFDSPNTVIGKVLASNPQPLAWIYSDQLKKRINIIDAELAREKNLEFNRPIDNKEPFFVIMNKILYLVVSDGAVSVSSLQVEGKIVVDSKTFINGYASRITI